MDNSKSSSSNRVSFMVAVAVAAVLLAVAIIVFSVLNSERIKNENRKYLLDDSRQTAENIDSAVSDGFDNIKILGELVSRSLTSPEFDITDIQGLIKNSVFDFMEFADKDGMDHNITGGVSDARDRQYYLDAKAGNTGMETIYVSRATHETLFMFYSPVYYDGEFVGSLIGVYQAANRVTKLLDSEFFGVPTKSYLLTGTGRIIASNDGYDPDVSQYATDLFGTTDQLKKELTAALGNGRELGFTTLTDQTGGYLIPLSYNGWFIIQVFPQEATNKMINDANALGVLLSVVLVCIYIGVLVIMFLFYRNQRMIVEEAREQAESANKSKTDFLFSMSHDIRTPMNAITGYTTMAKKYIDDKDKVNDCLDKIGHAGSNLLELVNQVLDMSRLESGKIVLKEEKMNIVDHASEMMEMMERSAETKNIMIECHTENVKNRFVYADYGRINQIILNILGNAIKYTPEGGRVSYTIDQIPFDDTNFGVYRLIVNDNGIGMSEEYVKQIFEPFSRENTSTVSKIEGTGLGMSIVKRLADLMGGKIEIQSKPGVGTKITVTFTLKLQGVTEDEQVETKAIDYSLFKGRRALLVEDNEMNREIAKDLLTEQGVTVEEAEDGDIAVEMIEKIAERKDYGYYDFILMDIQMPRMNGYEATKRIRAMRGPADVHIPIIAMTANAFEEDRINAIMAGMDEHISKPVNIDKLWETLMRFL